MNNTGAVIAIVFGYLFLFGWIMLGIYIGVIP